MKKLAILGLNHKGNFDSLDYRSLQKVLQITRPAYPLILFLFCAAKAINFVLAYFAKNNCGKVSQRGKWITSKRNCGSMNDKA